MEDKEIHFWNKEKNWFEKWVCVAAWISWLSGGILIWFNKIIPHPFNVIWSAIIITLQLSGVVICVISMIKFKKLTGPYDFI
jgi:hypothetical protein